MPTRKTTGWDTGKNPIWKASDQHVFSDRFLVEVQYGHIGNNFTLTFQDPAQAAVQPTFAIDSGIWGRSFNESIFVRPAQSVDLTTSYFLPDTLGGDHSFKAGYRQAPRAASRSAIPAAMRSRVSRRRLRRARRRRRAATWTCSATAGPTTT